MSATRAILSTLQAACNQRAMMAPNPKRPESRYYNTHVPRIIAIAPLIFHIHAALMWICALGEIISFALTLHPAAPAALPQAYPFSPVTFSSISSIAVTPLFLVGIILAVIGTYMRVDCFRELGTLYTFDLTIHPDHRLITSRFYKYIRHPAYAASILLIVGTTLSHLSSGGWLTECGPLRAAFSAEVIWVILWSWTLAVGLNRAAAEDAELRAIFGWEWEEWARKTPSWFIPGLI